MEITDEFKTMCIETAKQLTGSERRLFMARIVQLLGKGGQRCAAKAFGWSRDTIRLGMHELASGFRCQDHYSGRGRKRAEEHLPNLLTDIQDIVDEQSQTDPTFATTRLFTRLSAAEVRRQLLAKQGYTDANLPTEETIRVKLNALGYYPQRVQKSRPQKKIPETDAIFDELARVHAEAAQDETIVRISMDAKATVPIGAFSRGGTSRVEVHALDHDFLPEEKLTPFGIYLPDDNENHLFFTASVVTSDFIVDCLGDVWLKVRERFPHVTTLLINQDNGPENHSRRTQFMQRMSAFADAHHLAIHLAYYPPYHSKYNPIERVWGVLENYWNGSVLDSVDMVLTLASKMTWNGQHPLVTLVKKTYQTGVKLTQKAMAMLEQRFERAPHLPKWFVKISPVSP